MTHDAPFSRAERRRKQFNGGLFIAETHCDFVWRHKYLAQQTRLLAASQAETPILTEP
jgi:hypothetical protein